MPVPPVMTARNPYASLGGSTQRHTSSPEKLVAAFVGYPGEGKSALLQSVPESFLLNLDRSPTTTPTQHAAVWPVVNEEGLMVDASGEEVTLNWESVRQKLDTLRELAQSKNPDRPKTVIVDSVTAVQRMLISYLPANAKKHRISQEDRSEWNELHGPAAWDWVYNSVVSMIEDLKNQGYGVFVTMHIATEKIPIGENLYSIQPSLTITDNFWKRLSHIFDLVGYMARVEAKSEMEYEQKLPNGQTRTKRKSVKTTRYILGVDDMKLRGIVKSRVPFGQIQIPEEDGWSAFRTRYLEAANGGADKE